MKLWRWLRRWLRWYVGLEECPYVECGDHAPVQYRCECGWRGKSAVWSEQGPRCLLCRSLV